MASQSDATVPDVITERKSTGELTGVEVEHPDPNSSAEYSISEPFDPDDIEVNTRNPTIELLLSRVRDGAINLEPDFQRRRGIWTEDRQSRLIESILLKIPLPTLYAAEDEEENWDIIDGIQRLSTIVRFVEPTAIEESRLTLRGLDYLKDLEGKGFEELPTRLKRRLRETELVVHLIRHNTPDVVKFNIFARINTGGMVLSSQELRHALVPGKARVILGEWARSKAFLEATDYSVRDERMADRELLLRYIAFTLTPFPEYKYRDLDRFLVDAMKRLTAASDSETNELWRQFERAMTYARKIFHKDAFRKRFNPGDSRYPINKALFEAVSVNINSFEDDQLEKIVANRDYLMEKYMNLMRDPDFDRSISQGTGDIGKVRTRFTKIKNVLQEASEC